MASLNVEVLFNVDQERRINGVFSWKYNGSNCNSTAVKYGLNQKP